MLKKNENTSSESNSKLSKDCINLEESSKNTLPDVTAHSPKDTSKIKKYDVSDEDIDDSGWLCL